VNGDIDRRRSVATVASSFGQLASTSLGEGKSGEVGWGRSCLCSWLVGTKVNPQSRPGRPMWVRPGGVMINFVPNRGPGFNSGRYFAAISQSWDGRCRLCLWRGGNASVVYHAGVGSAMSPVRRHFSWGSVGPILACRNAGRLRRVCARCGLALQAVHGLWLVVASWLRPILSVTIQGAREAARCRVGVCLQRLERYGNIDGLRRACVLWPRVALVRKASSVIQ
jgi:hypothetical protein